MNAIIWTDEMDGQLLAAVDKGERMASVAGRLGVPYVKVKARLAVLQLRKPTPAAAKAKHRKCLCGCNRLFKSSGPGERIRPECRRTWEERV